MKQGFETKSETISTEKISNATVCKQLTYEIKKLPPHDPQRLLLEALYFALLRGEHPQHLSRRIRRERHHSQHSLTPLSETQAQSELKDIKHLRTLAKAKPLSIPGKRKLDAFRQEMLMLNQAGASLRDIRFWLFNRKRIKISVTTIQRYLKAIQTHE